MAEGVGGSNTGMFMPPNQWRKVPWSSSNATTSVYDGIRSSQSEYGGVGGWAAGPTEFVG